MREALIPDAYFTEPWFLKDYAAMPADLVEEWNRRWPDFEPYEIGSKARAADDRSLLVDPHAMDCLQELRRRRGRSVFITSGFRSDNYNRLVGGAKSSMHLKGRAFDIPMWNQGNPAEFEADARAAGFTGLGFYPPGKGHFIHVDTGRPREWGRRWW